MRFRFPGFNRSLGAANLEQPRKLSQRRSQRVSQSVDGALRPNVSEDQACNDETEKDSDNAIADVIEISVGRITLEDTVEKSECYL